MPSPFPGMDPYREAHWPDVRATLIVYLREQMFGQLKSPLRARVDERLVVESSDPRDRNINPDVRVSESPRSSSRGGTALLVAPRVDPLILPAPDEDATETYIEITDRSHDDRLVTVIELMSPSNKGRGRTAELYRRKQLEVRRAGVNLVEVDLTRSGRRQFLIGLRRIPRSHRLTFAACVYRARGKASQFELYPIPLSQPIPPIGAPLRPTDDDVTLDLQPLVARAYTFGG